MADAYSWHSCVSQAPYAPSTVRAVTDPVAPRARACGCSTAGMIDACAQGRLLCHGAVFRFPHPQVGTAAVEKQNQFGGHATLELDFALGDARATDDANAVTRAWSREQLRRRPPRQDPGRQQFSNALTDAVSGEWRTVHSKALS